MSSPAAQLWWLWGGRAGLEAPSSITLGGHRGGMGRASAANWGEDGQRGTPPPRQVPILCPPATAFRKALSTVQWGRWHRDLKIAMHPRRWQPLSVLILPSHEGMKRAEGSPLPSVSPLPPARDGAAALGALVSRELRGEPCTPGAPNRHSDPDAEGGPAARREASPAEPRSRPGCPKAGSALVRVPQNPSRGREKGHGSTAGFGP